MVKARVVLCMFLSERLAKQIFLGAREADADIDYLKSFFELARRLMA